MNVTSMEQATILLSLSCFIQTNLNKHRDFGNIVFMEEAINANTLYKKITGDDSPEWKTHTRELNRIQIAIDILQ